MRRLVQESVAWVEQIRRQALSLARGTGGVACRGLYVREGPADERNV